MRRAKRDDETAWKPLAVTILASTLVSAAVLGGAVWYRRQVQADQTTTMAANKRPASQPAPLISPAAPQTTPITPRLVTLQPPYLIVDGLTLKSGEQTVRLADLDGPAREAICFDEKGFMWACGLQARAAINNATTERSLACKIIGREGDADVARCQVDRADLGKRLVAAGWARPTPGKEAGYSNELKAAAEAGAGLWKGGWNIRAALKPSR